MENYYEKLLSKTTVNKYHEKLLLESVTKKKKI